MAGKGRTQQHAGSGFGGRFGGPCYIAGPQPAASRLMLRDGAQVKWVGWAHSENTWEPAGHLKDNAAFEAFLVAKATA